MATINHLARLFRYIVKDSLATFMEDYMKIPHIRIIPTDPLKYFSFFKVERPAGEDPAWVHPLDRLFVRDPIRYNPRSTFRLSIPAMYPDDRTAACEVIAAMALMYKFSNNHIRMLDYAHTVRLYDEMCKHVIAAEKAVHPEDEN
jgi:hypothetical protein